MLENHQPGSDSIVSSPTQLEEIVKKGAKPIVIVFGDGQKRFYPINFGDFARLPELTDNGRSVNGHFALLVQGKISRGRTFAHGNFVHTDGVRILCAQKN